ncbi:alpha/beta hydrolase [Candidatus Pelagibacter sp.]|nr:alpha/beta hydrolase [Candidatus Pelagibacter sp.]|tara:strand:- start:834 stop:1490 length:657 start_codon:yes stop_codon:yes gene_type:complete
MTFCLDTTIIPPENNEQIKNAVILLHGYGGDGKDISVLTLTWKRFLKNTVFLCPNGHEICEINPQGYQWFDLSKNNEEYILQKSLIAETIIKKFIEEVKIKYKLSNNNVVLGGFSQGCMLSINVGVTSQDEFNCIVGFSGKIINKENLQSRIKNKSKILLIHGDQDEIVSSSFLLESKDFFERNKFEIKTNLIKNCGHHIPIDASSMALNFIKKNLFL